MSDEQTPLLLEIKNDDDDDNDLGKKVYSMNMKAMTIMIIFKFFYNFAIYQN